MQSKRRGVPLLASLASLGMALLALPACPDLPESSIPETDVIDGEVFVPLSLSRVMESIGEPAGGERVTLFGAGFTAGAEVGLPVVRFGSARADAVLVLDDGQINATVPAHEAGLVDVTVQLPDGQEETLADAYLYRGPLAITSISPAAASIDGGVAVEVRGAGFFADTRILVGGRMLEEQRVVDQTTIVGTVPSRLAVDAGFQPTVDVIATNGFEQRTLERAFTYAVPLTVSGIAPISGPHTGGTRITLTGTGLSLATVVRIGGVPAENVDADGHGAWLVVRTPPGPHGTADVVAENTTGSPGSAGSAGSARAIVTLPDAFFHVDEGRLPGVLWAGHAMPASGPRSGNNAVAISVRGLTAAEGVTVRFGQVEATVTEVRFEEGAVVVTAPPATDEGTVQVRVARGGVEAQAVPYEYVGDFFLERTNPTFGPLDGPEVALFGQGLLREAEVFIGGKPAEVRSGGGERLVVRAAPGVPGAVDVVVRVGERVTLLSAGFEYRSATPKLWAVSPELGAQAGGRIVRLFGEGFQDTPPDPKFRDTRGEEFAVVDDHVAIVRAPRGDPGHVNVGGPPLGRIAMPFAYHDPSQRFGGTAGGPIPEALNVTVLDRVTREGVPDAFVILWDDIDGPYQGLTDDRGQITFSDVYFGPMQMVTAGADDYTTASIVEFDARDATLNLIPLRPSNPGGGGGGGPGPEPLPNSVLSGKVLGFDKYVVTPPGSCEARLGRVDGTLCAPCVSHEECEGEGAMCTPLGKEGARCTTACAIDADCPPGFGCAGVEGGVQCVPESGRRTARCQVTMPDVFSLVEVPPTPTNSEGVYSFSTSPGEYAVVCLGGVEDDITGVFTPLIMGVRRHVFAQPGEAVPGQDVVLDIPLTRDLRIRLDGAPVGRPKTELHTAQVFVNLGADGVFLMPQEGAGIDQNVFELGGFPSSFSESLYDASLTVYATAIDDAPPEDQTGVGSFVMQDGIKQLFTDAVFELATETGVRHRATGMSEPVFAMRSLPGSERLWAVGADGRVAAWDGTLWGLQQTPTASTLRGVWPASDEDVWAVGDAGAVVRFDGLRWLAVPMPAAVARADWWGIEGVREAGVTTRLWVWGERGVFMNDTPERGAGDDWVEVPGPLLGSVRAVRAVSRDEAWLVGTGGLIRRWQAGAFTTWDVPGADLHAVTIVRPELAWAVGDDGRILRWDGAVWFELLPVTARGLHGVAAARDDSAWAVGDAGEVVRWDGVKWTVAETVPHSDLFAVGETPSGRVFAAGVATLIVGPFMQLPRPVNPNAVGNLTSLNLRWALDPGADASFNWIRLFHPSGFPFWQIVAAGPRRDVPLPDLTAAWGLPAMWPGEDYMTIVRAYVPGFDMAAWDETILTPYRWRSWAVEVFTMNVPESE